MDTLELIRPNRKYPTPNKVIFKNSTIAVFVILATFISFFIGDEIEFFVIMCLVLIIVSPFGLLFHYYRKEHSYFILKNNTLLIPQGSLLPAHKSIPIDAIINVSESSTNTFMFITLLSGDVIRIRKDKIGYKNYLLIFKHLKTTCSTVTLEKISNTLSQNYSLWKKVPKILQEKISLKSLLILERIVFSEREDFKLSENDKILIVAHIAIVVVNLNDTYINLIKEVIVYPDSNTINCGGSSHGNGVITLSFEMHQYSNDFSKDCYNVVYHEVAHELDRLDGYVDGKPEKRLNNASTSEWGNDFSTAYILLKRELKRNTGPTLIREYGAKEPCEFFAVLTEIFFEQPKELLHQYPKLYKHLQRCYNLHPAMWDSEE